MAIKFTLSDAIDVDGLKAEFSQSGRIEIRDFLAAGQAERLRRHLLERTDWKLILNSEKNVFEISREGFAQLDSAQRSELETRVIASGRHQFQYRYEAIRVEEPDSAKPSGNSMLGDFVDFMSSQPVISLMASITGFRDIAFADGQATAYSTGHFLTSHDDDVAGKNRRAAYVFGLSSDWRAEWGGLLMFHGPDGNIKEAFTPAMGAIRLFAVPCVHSVSYVSPLAAEARISVTGWLRSQA